ncbi:MAG: hypothetical protein HLUCCO07_01040 [Rhodobacteraceae bacterium HLUCCO07]|nr:MAG: hypothetical protein HLUCCO07_01040 [Rhodobacteraceae bacterium HLUCCO07]
MTRKSTILTLTALASVALVAALTFTAGEDGQETARLAAPAPVTAEPL